MCRFCARWWVCTMVEPQHMPSVAAEARCVPFLCPEARCSRFCARWWVCTMVEPQHMPSVPAEAVCLALSRVRWCSMPVASAEAQKKNRPQFAACFGWGGLARLKYAVCKVYSLVFFLVYNFCIYLCGLYVCMS